MYDIPRINRLDLPKKRLNSDKAIQDMLNDMNQYDISRKMTNDLSSDPNFIYETLHDHIAKMKDKHLPYKFHKHKQKNNKWISFGIIRSIKTRDAMYLKSKCCSKQSVEYNTLKKPCMSSIAY